MKSGWQANFFVAGRRSKRIRRTFVKKYDAEQFEISEKAKAQQSDYQPAKKDKRTLQELANEWYKLHGSTLKDGKKRLGKITAIIKRLGNPLAGSFKTSDWLEYRNIRLKAKLRGGRPISINAVNHEHAYISAIFGRLVQLRVWTLPNPMNNVPKIKMDEPDLTYLELNQVSRLLEECKKSKNPDLYIRVKVCLATGARWGEVEKLTRIRIRAGKVHYVKTKNSNARAVPIDAELEKETLQGRNRTGQLFTGACRTAFQNAIQRAGIELPRGQLTHVLRHTYAATFIINRGLLDDLRKLLGHKTISQTVRYAKLAPAHLEDSLTKNPIAALKCLQSVYANEQKTD